MPYPATVIANEFFALAKRQGDALTPMKLQKLVYFAHGWCLALTEQALISDQIQAWQYGPVIPSIYHEFKEVGNGPITNPATEMRYERGMKFVRKAFSLDDYPETEERQHAKEIIAKVFEIYGKYSAVRLSNATHLHGTPWQQVYQQGSRHQVISNDVIKDYFKRLADAPAS